MCKEGEMEKAPTVLPENFYILVYNHILMI